MPRGKPSGYKLTKADAAVVLGMSDRGDRDHDIAAWFGVNQGRIAEAKDGSFGAVMAADASTLPPSGPPGVKGRRLRALVGDAFEALKSGDAAKAQTTIEKALKAYDKNEG